MINDRKNKPTSLQTLPGLCLMVLSVLLCNNAMAQPETVNLRPQWEVGQTARYSFWTKSVKDENTQLMGQTQKGTTTFENVGEMVWTVDQVKDDGSSVCTMVLNQMKITVTPPRGEQVVVDSANPSGDVPLFDQLLAAMIDSPLTVYVNPDGSIDRVDGVEAMENAAGAEAAENVPDEIDFRETASELATLIAAPEEAGPGQTWTASNTWQLEEILPGVKTSADFDTTFTLEQIGGIQGVPVAAVRFQSAMDLKIDLSGLPEGAPDVDIRVGETQARGEVLFDLSRHETVARNDMTKYVVTVTVPMRPDVTLTATITQTTTSQLLRLDEDE